MPKIKGDNIILGLARENNRLEYTEPTVFIRARTPAGLQVQTNNTDLKETTNSSMESFDTMQSMAEAGGDVEVNVRAETFGLPLLSHFGQVDTTDLSNGVSQHEFSILPADPQYPTLSGSLAQGNGQDFEYPGMLFSSMEFTAGLDDPLTATLTAMAIKEAKHDGDFTPVLEDDDPYFRPQDITLYLVDEGGDLDNANAEADITEITLSSNNNTESKQTLGGPNPADMLTGSFSISGSFTSHQNNQDYRDIFANNERKKLRIKAEREDIDIGGGNHPTIMFDFPKITLSNHEPDRSIDDISYDSVEFSAHYSLAEAQGIKATLINRVSTL